VVLATPLVASEMGCVVTTIAVVAHSGKTFGGGLDELRATLAREGFADPVWYEVPKSRKAPTYAKRALRDGADVVFVWGGDGTVQRCVDALAGTDAVVAILPAGTANLLATNLGVPTDIEKAVRIGLHGERKLLDTGSVNGEHFTVMAGAGLDALMIKDADGRLKDGVGRVAYLWTGAKNIGTRRVKVAITVDGKDFFRGRATCVLFGNVSKAFGGIKIFPRARPDDGILEVGVVTAKGLAEWARTVGRVATGKPDKSPFVRTGRGTSVKVRFDRTTPYELDGGARPATKTLKVKLHPRSIRVCVPPDSTVHRDSSAC